MKQSWEGLLVAGLIFVLAGSMPTANLAGQTASDLNRYSYLNALGTARAMGVGGAMGALGADFSALSINPAGVAAYWKSEFMVTPMFHFDQVSSSLNGGPREVGTRANPGLSNLGIVFTTIPYRGNWKAVSFGFGLNKQQIFRQDFGFSGESTGSITDRFAGLAAGLDANQLDAFEAGLAHQTGAIFDVDGDRLYETDFIGQEQIAFRKAQQSVANGYMNEFAMSFGGNFKDKVLLGMTIGMPFVSYTSDRNYRESDPEDRVANFISLGFEEFLRTEGRGMNVKLGVIAKVNDLRLGASFHSGTSLILRDEFSNFLEYTFDQGNGRESYSAASPEGSFEYRMITPIRGVLSAAKIFRRQGFVSADLEYTHFRGGRFDLLYNSNSLDDQIYQEEVNREIGDTYINTLNLRLGGEMLVNKLRYRAGVQFLGDPLADGFRVDPAVTLGVGIRGERVFLDLGAIAMMREDRYLPYRVNAAPLQQVDNKNVRLQALLTLGFKI